LIEETVAFNADLSSIGIRKLIANLQPHNELAKPWFDEPWQAFLPMCRMSFRMIDAALEFRKTHGQFAFLEVMFSSLMSQLGMRYLNWCTQLGFLRFFSKFHYRPAIEEIKLGICHAVKDAAIHEAICVLEGKPRPGPAVVLAEGQKLMARYSGNCTGKWFDGDNYYRWKMWFAVEQPIKMLEIGAGDGMSANLILDAIFTHEKSEVHCIENFDEQEPILEIFNENAKRGRYETRLPLYEGATAEILAWMITEEGYWESFDFIHQTKNETAAELLASACQSWPLLKMHGAMAFSNLTNPKVKAAMNAWIAAYQDQLEVMWTPDEERLIVTKKPAHEKQESSSGPFGAMAAENLGGRGNDEGAAEGVSPLRA
jgi:predicted O-methyltransferase YrrM